MTPDDEKGKVETEVVDETTLEEVPVEPEADATEADAPEEEAPEAPAEEEAAEEPVAEEKPAAKTKPAAKKKPAAPKAEEPPAEKAKPAAKPGVGGAGSNGRPVVKAHAKYVRTSARKARLICDHIRGKSVIEARAILAHTPRAVAEDWEKLLNSAVANAEHNHELLGEDLKILSVTADEGPTLKRFRPRAMGRASAIRKRTSHLSIALTPKEQ
jgi:large subunit ribosomal protein L22